MSTLELKERLIGRIRETDNEEILAEVYRLLGMEEEDEPYRLSPEQRASVQEARNQIRNGSFLTNKEADNEVDEWLKK
jgi:hypothetical protein